LGNRERLYADIYYDKYEGEMNWAKFRDKIVGTQIEEDIHELSAEDEQ